MPDQMKSVRFVLSEGISCANGNLRVHSDFQAELGGDRVREIDIEPDDGGGRRIGEVQRRIGRVDAEVENAGALLIAAGISPACEDKAARAEPSSAITQQVTF